jgi:PAS domain S-box-containing protein
MSEIRYQNQLELSGDGILIVDPDSQKIIGANAPIIALLGTLEELLDKELWEVGLFRDREECLEIFRELNEKGIVRHNNLVIHTKDGQHRDLEFAASIYAADDHRIAQCNVRDITERRRSDRIASHLAAIVESSDDAIISKTLEGVILSWNQAAERIFGYTAEEIIGRPVDVLIPPELRDEEPTILQKLRSGERIDHYETVRVTKDGRRVNISLTISPIKDRDGKIIAASKIARDISERKRHEDERERLLAREQAARAEAERANRMSDEFLATVSHELRTPLNAILGWSHLLSSGRVNGSTATRAIEAIERNARAQAQLVEDILDVSRVITGKLRLRIGPVDLVSVINAAIDSVQLAADSKGIRFEVTLDPSARRISGDSNRLQQVVWNLLSNAIKFTPPGGRVEIRLEQVYPHVQISVRDNGPGISPDFLPYIFDRFRQADGTTTRRHGGLGLGLSIVRHLVELHGGSVQAESSEKEGGATFTLKLPIAASEAPTPVPRKETEVLSSDSDADPLTTSVPSLEGLRILLVDDDRDNLQILTVLLTEHKANVQPVSSAAEALEVLEWYSPDVLVSDLAMPGEDGFSLIDKVRALEMKSGGHIPAVALTAYVRVEDRARALSRGFNVFVPKPVEPSELITAIANLAEAGHMESVSREQA